MPALAELRCPNDQPGQPYRNNVVDIKTVVPANGRNDGSEDYEINLTPARPAGEIRAKKKPAVERAKSNSF
jgi:hypothetical protein